MKNSLMFVTYHDYIIKLINNRYIKDISVQAEGDEKGFMYYHIEGKRYKIPPIENANKVIENTIAALLIMEGYVVVNNVEGVSIVSNEVGDTYFVNGNQCSCPDRFSPCKHVFFANWLLEFRKEQVRLLHQTTN